MTGIGQFLKLLSRLTNNHYILALLLFALVIEIIMLPFGIMQQKNSIKQARLRPKEMAIRKKYAGRDDNATKQKIAQEIQELYQKEHFNQFAGCLPLLLQIPIIMILYYVVINPLHYEMRVSTAAIDALRTFLTTATTEGGLGLTIGGNARSTIEIITHLNNPETWANIQSGFAAFVGENGATYLGELEAAMAEGLPNLYLFNTINLGLIPTITQPSWLWAVPVLTFGTYFGSMKLTRRLTYQPTTQTQDMGCSNKVMDIAMPLFSVYITFVVPAAVGVYWIFKSILGTGKQFILYKAMPLPKFTEEDYKAAERELAGKAPKRSSQDQSDGPRPAVRSLHHIDDDDYLPPVNKAEIAKEEEPDAPAESTAGAEPPAGGIIESAQLKDDDRRSRKSKKAKKGSAEDTQPAEEPAAEESVLEEPAVEEPATEEPSEEDMPEEPSEDDASEPEEEKDN